MHKWKGIFRSDGTRMSAPSSTSVFASGRRIQARGENIVKVIIKFIR
jgi:hypothetical protein